MENIFVTVVFVFFFQQRAPGKVLHDAVCNHLNLVEGDYFGLEFPDHKKMMVCKRINFSAGFHLHTHCIILSFCSLLTRYV